MILIASELSIFNRFMGFFFNGITGVAVLAGGSTNFCNEADFLGDGDLLVNSGVREETDLAAVEPRVALFDFGEDTLAEGVVGVFGVFVAAFGGAFGRLGIIVFP
jgi:hypothetical protein